MKHKLLKDIMIDLTVCELEGWDKKEYIRDLAAMLNGLLGEDKTDEDETIQTM